MNLIQWIDEKLKDIATKLPLSIHQDPASFACGHNSGYKAAMLDLIADLNNKHGRAITTPEQLQAYLKEFIAYERTLIDKDNDSDFVAGETTMLDRIEDMVDDCLDMLEIIINNKEG